MIISQIIEQQEVSFTNSCEDSFEILIDYVEDEDFGRLYRVWEESKLLGTYYESFTGKWHLHLSNLGDFIPCDSKEIAINKIIESRF